MNTVHPGQAIPPLAAAWPAVRVLTRVFMGPFLIAATLAACGGGTGAPSSGASASATVKETAFGAVTGFGSVIVERSRYSDETAAVFIDVDPTTPSTGTATSIGLGTQVEVAATGDVADTITVSAAVIGRVQTVAADRFTVAGQTIVLSADPAAPTWFEGVSGIVDLAVGDRVEVHGARDPDSVIVASRVEVKDPRSPAIVRVVGTVAGLDAAGGTFTVGGLLVAYGTATRIVPSGQSLADGQTVVVFSDSAVIGDRLDAKAIRITRRQVADGTTLRVGGLIRALDFAGQSFVLEGFRVDASAASFAGGTSADLANGRAVRVVGRVEGGTLVAREVRFRRLQAGEHAVALTGAMTDFVSSQSFRIRGVPIDASGSAVVFAGGDAGNLGDGVVVRVTGDVDGNVVAAASVEFIDTTDGRVRGFVGIVDGYDAATGTFRLGNAAMRLSAATSYRNADFSAAGIADFGNGDRVQVRGQWRAGVFEVSEVVFRPGVAIVITRTGGSAYAVEATAGAFRLNGVLVTTDGETTFTGRREDLRNGATVIVEGRLEGGRLVAISVEIGAP